MAQKITEIEAGLKDWELLKKLPKKIEGFVLKEGSGIQGQIINIASYVDEINHCSVDLIYTGETFDYVIVKNIGLHTFRDDRFFSRDQSHFAAMVLQELPALLHEISNKKEKSMGYEAREMGFAQWEYWKTLPKKVGNYELYITPETPLEYINGSWVFLDYSDFTNGNQLMFLYNGFRNELFAELKKGYLPVTTDDFNANSLAVLENVMKKNLLNTLQELEK